MKQSFRVILLLSATIAATYAVPIKQKLAELKSTQAVPALPECPCVFDELPGLGAGLATGFEQRAEAQ